jgi:tRNA/rRNA methyltransferase
MQASEPEEFPPAPCVVLDRPQLAENIGAVARVMANFGLHELRLVAPRDGWPQDRAWASASGADWPLDRIRVFETVADAIADRRVVYAATARPRETQLPVLTPREAAASLSRSVGQGLPSAILFGAERAGLETHDVALCNAILTIPIDPRFRSLNLSHAVGVCAYEWRLTVMEGASAAFAKNQAPPADNAAMMGLYQHLEDELEASGFFHPPEKKPAMIRNLRVALGRARFTDQEARTFRGVITALVKGRGQTLERLARRRGRGDG